MQQHIDFPMGISVIKFQSKHIFHKFFTFLVVTCLDYHFHGHLSSPVIVKCNDNTVSHFSYAPHIKCKITRNKNIQFLFWDYKYKAHLYLYQPLKFYFDQMRNKWANGSWRALPSKHQLTLHYFKWNLDLIAHFSGSNFYNARDKSRFILGNI